MDRRTHEGMSTGTVILPGRSGQPVHVGVWFRLLRTLIDELSTPISTVRASSRDDLNRIWQASGHPPRAGLSVWCPYEKLDWPRQQGMLEAAATALHLVETGAITARGSLGHLLAVQPHRPADSGQPWFRTDVGRGRFLETGNGCDERGCPGGTRGPSGRATVSDDAHLRLPDSGLLREPPT